MTQEEIDLEFNKSLKVIKWLVNGVGKHCIPFYLWKFVTYEWLEENYNFYQNETRRRF